MAHVGTGLVIVGDIESSDDLVIDGCVTGTVWSEGHLVTIATSGTIDGGVIARDVTVLGSVSGDLIASGVAHICSSASVTGRIVCARLILEDGGWLQGTVEPQQLAAALAVARHRRQSPAPLTVPSRDAESSPTHPPVQ